MNITMGDVRLIRVDAYSRTIRRRTKGSNIWGIGPINPFLDYVPSPEQWQLNFDIERLLKYELGNCDEVWEENGHVLFSTTGKTSQAALRKLERKLTQISYEVPHWSDGWLRCPTYGRAICATYNFLFPREMCYEELEQQLYQWPWLQLVCRNVFPQCDEIKTDPLIPYHLAGKPVRWFALHIRSKRGGMQHFVPKPQSLALLADLLSIQLQRPIVK